MKTLQVLFIVLFVIIALFLSFQYLTYVEEVHKTNVEELSQKVNKLLELNQALENQVPVFNTNGEDIEYNQEYYMMFYEEKNEPEYYYQENEQFYDQGEPDDYIIEYYYEFDDEDIEENEDEDNLDDSLPNEDPNLPFSEWETKWKCYRLEDYTDICVYKNLCFDGSKLIFLNNERPVNNNLYEYRLRGPESGVNFDYVYWDPSPFPPPMSKYVPYMSTFGGTLESPPEVNTETLESITDSIEIIDGAMYYTPYEHNAGNIWHVSMQMLNLWESQMLNETLNDYEKLPPMDYVVELTPFLFPGWKRQTQRVMVQNHTQFLTLEWFKQKNIDLDELHYGRHYDNATFPPNWQDNFSPPLRKHSDVEVSSKNVICSRDAVVLSQKPRLFSGIHSSTLFREKAYALAGIELGRPKGLQANRVDKNLSYKVLIDHRGEHESRSLINSDEIVSLVEYYGLEANLRDSYRQYESYETQVREVSEADIYIIVHGAGVTNCMFMTPRSTLIEISPYGMRVPMYKYAAESLGINYVNIVSQLKGPIHRHRCGAELHSTEFFNDCQTRSSMENNLYRCNILSKNACAVVPLYDLEIALINAYDFMGVNINPRVNELFSFSQNLNRTIFNDYHDSENYLIVRDLANLDPSNYTKEYAPIPSI